MEWVSSEKKWQKKGRIAQQELARTKKRGEKVINTYNDREKNWRNCPNLYTRSQQNKTCIRKKTNHPRKFRRK